jgi:hypothetical protein
MLARRRGQSVFFPAAAILLVSAIMLGSCIPLFGLDGLADQEADGLSDPVPIDEIDIGGEDELEIDISVTSQRLPCPSYTQYFLVDYAHILTLEGPGLELREESGEPHVFSFLVSDGQVSQSEFIASEIPLNISGQIQGCSLAGNGIISANISGTCTNDRLELKIVEERLDWGFSFTNCDQQPAIPDSFPGSAPEIQHSFIIDTAGDNYFLQADAGMVSFYYSWTVIPDPDFGVVPPLQSP